MLFTDNNVNDMFINNFEENVFSIDRNSKTPQMIKVTFF